MSVSSISSPLGVFQIALPFTADSGTESSAKSHNCIVIHGLSSTLPTAGYFRSNVRPGEALIDTSWTDGITATGVISYIKAATEIELLISYTST